MPKSLALGNGNILILLDQRGQVHDFYFPYVGLENHVGGRFLHRIGVYVNKQIYWFSHPSWKIAIDYEKESLCSQITATNDLLKVRLEFKDVVYNEKNIFIRRGTVHNLDDQKRRIKIFFDHEFEIYESHRGDTAYYDPIDKNIVHYKGRRVFVINASRDKNMFDDYSVGLFGIEGKEGTFKDAEDGELSKNAIEHGLVDSVIGLYFDLEPQDSETFYYWITSSKSIKDAQDMNDFVFEKTPQYLIKTTEDYWHAWVNRQNFHFDDLEEKIINLFKKSLFIIRTHTDNNGAIIAAGDSDMLQYGRDTYSYMWPRDGAFSAIALDKAGDLNVAKRFFEFCNDVITEDGYLMHKYRPDKSLGSSWHPWIRDGKAEFPIQEDETALVIYALWKHYKLTKDLEFIENIYNSLIKKAADFMVFYLDDATGLPMPSYDLWEEKFGISTFTASTVYAALVASAKFAHILGKTNHEEKYNQTAQKVKSAILQYLYNEKESCFYKMINFFEDQIIFDRTLDTSSVYGIFKFKVLDANDERLKKNMDLIREKLTCKTVVGGFVRYEGDQYYRVSQDTPGNPWFITTLWMAQYSIVQAKQISDLDQAKKCLEWVAAYASPSGILSEQLNPFTGEQISAAPLTWSHSEFVVTVIQYLSKLESLKSGQIKTA